MEEKFYNLENVSAISVTCRIDSLPVLIDMEDIYAYDGDLIVANGLDTFAFYRFSLPELSMRDRFGRRGEGPDEIIDPNILLVSESRRLYVVDTWRQRMYDIQNGQDTISIGDDIMNMAREIKWPYIGYYCLNGGGREFYIRDIQNSEITDSLCVSDLLPDLRKTPFFWDTNSKKAVLAFNTSGTLMILDINDGKLHDCIIGKESTLDEESAFLSVQCLDSCFMVLNNRQDTEGSRILVFDYECSLIGIIECDATARRMAYDKSHNLMVMTGMTEDNVYSFKIPQEILF